jgi:drug/metabolite transporter (DMT)-like permease
MRSDNTKLAITYGILAAFFYAVLGTLMKITELQGATNETVVFFRQLVGLLALSPIIVSDQSRQELFKTQRIILHVIRAVAGLLSMYCLVFALKYLPIVDALMISYARPLFLPLILLVWFRKRWSKTTFVGILIGFLGVALILKPDKQMFDIAALAGLASALLGAVSFTCIRKLTRTDSANTILVYYLLLSIPMATFPLFFNWKTPSLMDLLLFFIIGICGLIYQMTLTRAYQHAKAFKVSSILYSTVIFGAVFDWYLGDFSLDYIGFVGIILIIVGNLITIQQKISPIPSEFSEKTSKNIHF